MLVALCILALCYVAFRATTRERLFICSLVGYLFLTAGLLSGCLSARRAGAPVAQDSVGLKAEEIQAPRPARGPVPATRRARRQAERIERRENRRDRRAERRALVAAAQPARIKIKHVGKQKDKSRHVAKDQRTTKRRDQSQTGLPASDGMGARWQRLRAGVSNLVLAVAVGSLVGLVCWWRRCHPLRFLVGLFRRPLKSPG